MEILNINDSDFKTKFNNILNRAKVDIADVSGIVIDIINNVKKNKEKALFEDIKKFDKWEAKDSSDLFIKKDKLKEAYDNLDENLKKSLHLAYDRIEAFHKKQLPKSWIDFENNGTILGQKVTPVKRAGLYIPGGKAAYPSSLLMNAIPAIVAGVEDIVVATPTPENDPNKLLLAAAYICNIKTILKVGGASAIAALAYGLDSLEKVDVITGPGNIFVATAKKMVYGDVNIDMIAGPSEIGIIADSSANYKLIAIDLLSQAEHDELASSILITTSKELADKTKDEVYNILKNLKRKDIAQKSIDNKGAIIVVNNLDEALSLMDLIAPEHLEILTKNPFDLLPKIKNAGAIFLGENTPEPIGDYIAGPNHTLPTGSTAKFYSPLGVEHFMKKSSIISFSKKALLEVANETILLANTEGLEAHAKSIEYRL